MSNISAIIEGLNIKNESVNESVDLAKLSIDSIKKGKVTFPKKMEDVSFYLDSELDWPNSLVIPRLSYFIKVIMEKPLVKLALKESKVDAQLFESYVSDYKKGKVNGKIIEESARVLDSLADYTGENPSKRALKIIDSAGYTTNFREMDLSSIKVNKKTLDVINSAILYIRVAYLVILVILKDMIDSGYTVRDQSSNDERDKLKEDAKKENINLKYYIDKNTYDIYDMEGTRRLSLSNIDKMIDILNRCKSVMQRY